MARRKNHRRESTGASLSRARQLRRESTWPERRLWSLLRNRRLSSVRFRRQESVGPYIVDFLCATHRLVIEVDGESHIGRGTQDEQRDSFLRAGGYRVLRVTNDDVLRTPDAVLEAVLRELGMRQQNVATTAARSDWQENPHP